MGAGDGWFGSFLWPGEGAVFGSVFLKEKGRAAAWEHKIKTTGGIPGFDLLPLKKKWRLWFCPKNQRKGRGLYAGL